MKESDEKHALKRFKVMEKFFIRKEGDQDLWDYAIAVYLFILILNVEPRDLHAFPGNQDSGFSVPRA